MLRYPCLVLDHDDTVVRSEETLNYPAFLAALDRFRPGETITKQEYTRGCFSPGFLAFCQERYRFTQEELDEEYLLWQSFVRDKIAPLYDGIGRLIEHYRSAGGILCVVSHSAERTIRRDYQHYFGFVPERIYSWDDPPERRKPNPWPLMDLMENYGLSPADILVVDDLKPGCDMAKAAGAASAFAGWSRKDIPEIAEFMNKHCDFSFDSPEDLEKFLL